MKVSHSDKPLNNNLFISIVEDVTLYESAVKRLALITENLGEAEALIRLYE